MKKLLTILFILTSKNIVKAQFTGTGPVTTTDVVRIGVLAPSGTGLNIEGTGTLGSDATMFNAWLLMGTTSTVLNVKKQCHLSVIYRISLQIIT